MDNFKHLRNEYLAKEYGFDKELLLAADRIEDELSEAFSRVDDIAFINQAKVLKAFKKCGISDMHFGWNTGYGYDDAGRDAVERVFAETFSAEKALVRPNIVNGTHAISLAILGLLGQGDKLIYCTGKPYDTLNSVIESAVESGVEYETIDLGDDGSIDLDGLKTEIIESVSKTKVDYDANTNLKQKTIMVAIQRSKGYSLRNSIIVNQIENVANLVNEIRSSDTSQDAPTIIIMIDNCYSEFTEIDSPVSVGADIICGSLIKNPGGGLALTGGYLCGKAELIDKVAFRLTCPGIGAECGLTFGQNRNVLQGLFLAPMVTANAVKGAMFCGKLFDHLGYDVYPAVADSGNFYNRCDIIQAVVLNTPEAVQAFCSGIQSASPIDSNVTPVPAPMPGYDDEIIMAAGTFVQGASIELSADGPLREPYAVYFQGGLTYEHSKIGALNAAQSLI